MNLKFLHSGKCGDIIYSLPTIRALGGGSLYLRPSEELGFTEHAAKSFLPLLEIQPYLTSVSLWNGEDVDHDLSAFRRVRRPDITNLADAHLQLFGLPSRERDQRWLDLPSASYHGKPVFARSLLRFDLDGFWPAARRRYPNAIFVGSAAEHHAFEAVAGVIEYWPTESFLELAKIIAGAHCFAGNQSAPYAIAEALKVDSIQEVDTWSPNCIFNRPNAFYVSRPDVLSTFDKAVKLIGNASDIGIASQPITELGPNVGCLGAAAIEGVTVIVLSFNSMHTLRECLESVIATLTDRDELIVVDNASTDGSREWIMEASETMGFKAVLNQNNLGFSAGCNVGIRCSRGRYITLLNPDTIVYEKWLQKMCSRFEDPDVGAVGPTSNCVAGSQYVELFLPKDVRPSSPLKLHEYVSLYNKEKTVRTKLLIGFCLMIKRECLNELGLLDENLYLGSEDLEISWRLSSNGRRLLVAGDVFVHHVGGNSFSSLHPSRVKELLDHSTMTLAKKINLAYGKIGRVSSRELWGIDIVEL